MLCTCPHPSGQQKRPSPQVFIPIVAVLVFAGAYAIVRWANYHFPTDMSFSLVMDDTIRRQSRPDSLPCKIDNWLHHVGDSRVQRLPRPSDPRNPWSRIADGQIPTGNRRASGEILNEIGRSPKTGLLETG